MNVVHIEHYSDVLCVWAYVAQVRMEEIEQTFGDAVEIGYRFVDVFGDCHTRLAEKWADRGGLPAYGTHVREVAARFPHAEVHPQVWKACVPQSSIPCHAFLHAVGNVARASLAPAARAMREAFFRDGIDVSSEDAQMAIAESLGLDTTAIETELRHGRAYCALSSDYRATRELGVTVSPTLVFNEGRQRLAGNVGYRVIEANVRELLKSPADEASWC